MNFFFPLRRRLMSGSGTTCHWHSHLHYLSHSRDNIRRQLSMRSFTDLITSLKYHHHVPFLTISDRNFIAAIVAQSCFSPSINPLTISLDTIDCCALSQTQPPELPLVRRGGGRQGLWRTWELPFLLKVATWSRIRWGKGVDREKSGLTLYVSFCLEPCVLNTYLDGRLRYWLF